MSESDAMGIKWMRFVLILAYFDWCFTDVPSTEMISTWIWSEGCRKLDSEIVISNLTTSGPAECFYECGNLSSSIAVQGHQCMCLETFTSQEVYEFCNICDDESELFCGKQEDDLWSLYVKGKDVQIGEYQNDTDIYQPICIAVKIGPGKFEMKTKPCKEKMRFLCRESSGKCLYKTDRRVGWSETPLECYEESASTINSLRLLELCVEDFEIVNSYDYFWVSLRQITFNQPQMPTQLLQTTEVFTSMATEVASPDTYVRNGSVFSSTTPSTGMAATSEAGFLATSENLVRDKNKIKSAVPTINSEKQDNTIQSTSSRTGHLEPLSSTTSVKEELAANTSGAIEVQTTKTTPRTTHSLSTQGESNEYMKEHDTSSTTHRPQENVFGATIQLLKEAKTENKSVQATSPVMAKLFSNHDENNEMTGYYAALGACILVLLLIIVIFLALVNRSIRELTKRHFSRGRRRGGSRGQNRYKSGSTTLLTDDPTYGCFRRNNGTHQNEFNNYEYQWDEHSSADELHDGIDDNALNRRNYFDGNHNRHALTLHRQRDPSFLHSGFTSTGRLQSEWF